MKICVFDVEANGLTPDKIWCLTAAIFNGKDWVQKTTTDYDEMRKFFNGTDIIIGHNIMLWDIPTLEGLLNIEIKAKVIDTLALSWYLYPSRPKHGLEQWGVTFGVPKPKVIDWNDPTLLPLYKHRCQEDVKINCNLWDKQLKDLHRIYDDSDGVDRIIDYIMYKMDCARAAQKSRWKLDTVLCKNSFDKLTEEKALKVIELKSIMPDVVTMDTMVKPDSLYKKGKTINKPKNYLKADNSLSVSGTKFKAHCDEAGVNPDTVTSVYVKSKEFTVKGLAWLAMLEKNNLPESHQEPIDYVKKTEDPNPNSHTQMKSFLFESGWKPITFNTNDKGEDIPQLRVEVGGEKQLCPSVKRLFKIHPKLGALEGLSILTHRLGILKGFLDSVDDDGFIIAEIQGLTNTLRFKHRTVVNLPSVKKPYGDIVRGVLIAPEGMELCGSDMSSLEDRTKQHYMWEYDPEYVKEMQTPDFDPHLALAEFAGALTPEQVLAHKEKREDHGGTRHLYKTANYSCTYGAGGKTLAATLDIPEQEGFDIVNAYRSKNWAINAISAAQKIKYFYKMPNGSLTHKIYKGEDLIGMDGDSKATKRKKYALANKAVELWLWNPVSKFWYSLRYPKDIFSTLNQGTGVFCFDTWIMNFRKKRAELTGQMHDEVILCLRTGVRGRCEKLLRDAIIETNEQLKLNRELDIDVQFGSTYAEIH